MLCLSLEDCTDAHVSASSLLKALLGFGELGCGFSVATCGFVFTAFLHGLTSALKGGLNGLLVARKRLLPTLTTTVSTTD